MKNEVKQSSFWLTIFGIGAAIGVLVLNKYLELNFTIAEISALFLAIAYYVGLYVGPSKVADYKERVIKTLSGISTHGAPIKTAFTIIGSKSEKGRDLIKEIENIIEESEELKKEIYKDPEV